MPTMRSFLTLFTRLADLVLVRSRDRRLDDEVRLHLELLTEDLVAAGWPPQRARDEARRRFGGVDQMKLRYRDRRGLAVVEALRQDLGFGLRLFARDRSLSLAIVSALALGIGATVTVFTILNAMLLRDVPFFRDPDRVMAIGSMDGRGRETGVSYDDFLDWRTAAAFAGMSAYAGTNAVLADRDRPSDRVNGVYVSAGTFELLGAAPALGRSFQSADDRKEAPMVILLAHGPWVDRFGGDPGVVGRVVRVNGTSATVIGVMPPGFTFPLTGDLWMPLASMPGATAGTRDRRTLAVVGRLADGVSLKESRAQLGTLAEALARDHPATNAGVRPVIVPFVSRYLGTFTTPEPLLLLTTAVVLLVIACANASTLLLTRAAVRAREIALRAAIGASRARIVRQLLVESVLLAAVSGLCGVGLAAAAVRALETTTGELGMPAWTRFEMDGQVPVGLHGSLSGDRNRVRLCTCAAPVEPGHAARLAGRRPRLSPAPRGRGGGCAGCSPHKWLWRSCSLPEPPASCSGPAPCTRADQKVEPAGVLTGRLGAPVRALCRFRGAPTVRVGAAR